MGKILNAEGELHKNKPIIKKEEMTLTKQYDIFTLVKRGKQVKIAVTNKIISAKEFKSFKEAETYINTKPWELLINTSCAVFDIIVKENLNNNQN